METKTLKEYVPGLAGVPAVQSKISYIDGFKGLLAYRGIPIEQLAERSTFAETAFLLIYGNLPNEAELTRWNQELTDHRKLKYQVRDVIKALPEGGHPMKALQAGTAVLGMFYPDEGEGAYDAPRQREAIVRLIAKLPTLVAAFHRTRRGDDPIEPRDDLDLASNFLWMLSGKEPDPLAARIMDVCLILHAEHSINASTFGALVTAATLADPYCVVSSAVGALAGSLHGGANERVLAMLREIGSVDRVLPYVDQKIAAGGRIMGVGHRVYKTKDPRATILQQLVVQMFEKLGSTPLYDIALQVERVVGDRLGGKGIYPNVDFYSGIVYDKMGIPTDLFTPIFAISRVAGWLAHWVEQIQDNKLFRPTQIYTGAHGQEYVPLADRS
ncbi:MAG TPA: citrate synthase [Patescibacteria group bacterium]|nr:citrate synthase [Patescibacteria group bacterium]